MIVWTRRNSDDGKQIFAVGAQRRSELVRYDPKTHDFLPYLGGISAADPTYSRDGKWMVYMSYPEHTLWRSRSDGSDRLQLAYSPVVVLYPRISPDGTKVAFSDANNTLYIVSMKGGTPQKTCGEWWRSRLVARWKSVGGYFLPARGVSIANCGRAQWERIACARFQRHAGALVWYAGYIDRNCQ
jgi:hypothetical protein